MPDEAEQMPAPIGRRETAKRARRHAFLHAAARVLARDGAQRATVDAIAAEAGVAKVVLYRYFPSREAIVAEVLDGVTRRIEAGLAEPWAGYGSGMRHLLAAARSQPDAFALLLGGGPVAAPYLRRCRSGLVARVAALADLDMATATPLQRLSTETVATLALDAAARWLRESGSEGGSEPGSGRGPDGDEAFLAWYAATTRALDRAWRG